MNRFRTLPSPLLTLVFSLLCAEASAAPEAQPADQAATAAAAEPTASGTLAVRLSGFRNAGGQVLIAVYRGGDGFPGEPTRAWQRLVTRITDGQASIDLRDVPPGEYAIAVVHDEDGDNVLDTSWIGLPQEGIGVSNNAKGRMGPPKYRDARFELTASGAVQRIRIVYM